MSDDNNSRDRNQPVDSTRREFLKKSTVSAGLVAGGLATSDAVTVASAAGSCPNYAEQCWHNFATTEYKVSGGKLRYARDVVVALTDKNSDENSSGGTWVYTFEAMGYHTVTFRPSEQNDFTRNRLKGVIADVGIEFSSIRGDIYTSGNQIKGSGVPTKKAYTYDDAVEDATMGLAEFAIGEYIEAGELVLEGASLAASMGEFAYNRLADGGSHKKYEWTLNDIVQNYTDYREKTDGQTFAKFFLEVEDDSDVADLNLRSYMTPNEGGKEFDASVDITLDQSMGGIE